MNETKHTPTPPPFDIHEREHEVHIDAPNGHPGLGQGTWWTMAIFYGDKDNPKKGRQVALSNARMFVEAHEVRRQRDELLEALELAVLHLEVIADHNGRLGDNSADVSDLEAARAAIAKAKGETNDTTNQ